VTRTRLVAAGALVLMGLAWAAATQGIPQAAGLVLFVGLAVSLLAQDYWAKNWVEALAGTGFLLALMTDQAIVLAALLAGPWLILVCALIWRGAQQTILNAKGGP
jgi:hypothetical protein